MKELYTLSPELLTQRPRVQVGGQIFEVDDRTATVRQMMEITRQQLPSDQQMDQVLRLALGEENFAKLEAMELMPSISALQQRGYIMAENKREKLIARKEFMLSPEVFNSLVEGSPVKPYQEKEQQVFDQFDLCAAVHELIEERSNETMETSQAMSMTEQIENEHADLPLVKELRKLVKECLTEREMDIIQQRYGLDGRPPRTQRELAKAYGISRSYVSRRR